jgi:hypothetical protein
MPTKKTRKRCRFCKRRLLTEQLLIHPVSLRYSHDGRVYICKECIDVYKLAPVYYVEGVQMCGRKKVSA